MFDFLKRLQQEVPADETWLQETLSRVAILQGQLAGMQVLGDAAIRLLSAEQRNWLSAALKASVGKGVHLEAPWLNDGDRQSFNNAFSAVLAEAIELIDQPRPPAWPPAVKPPPVGPGTGHGTGR
jgi:hypothetical protein